MEHNSPNSWLAGSDPQDSPPLTGESGSNNEDEEEFDAFGFYRSLANYKANPELLVDMTSVNDEAITTFIRQINHPLAKDLMAPFNCFRRYNNETEFDIWIQETEFQFVKPWMSRCDWKNCGPLVDKKGEKAYEVHYWTHKKMEFDHLRFRKYSIPGLPLAVYLVCSEPSSKKQKTAGPTNKAKKLPEIQNQPNSYQPTTQLFPYQNNSLQQPVTHQSPIQDQTYNTLRSNNNQMSDSYYADTQNNTNQTSGHFNPDQSTLYQQPYVEVPQNNDNLTSYDNLEQPMQDYEEVQLDWCQQVIENTERSKKNEQEIAKLKEEHVKLTAKHIGLEMKTIENTNGIEDLTDSVARLEIHSQKQIISAIIKILRDNGGTFPAVSKFASKVRELLDDKLITTQEVNGILKNILEKRGVVKRSTNKKNWILNEQVAKKFELK